jgi:hypothetical protein
LFLWWKGRTSELLDNMVISSPVLERALAFFVHPPIESYVDETRSGVDVSAT